MTDTTTQTLERELLPNFCLLIDELILSWQAKGNDKEQCERRVSARAALEAAIEADRNKRALSPAADTVKLTPYEFTVSGISCEWYLRREVDALLSLASQPKDMSTASTHAADMSTEAGNVNMTNKEIRQDYSSTGDILAEMTGCYNQDVMLWELADRARDQNAKLQKALAYTEGQASEWHARADALTNGLRRAMAELAEAQKNAELYQWLQERFAGYDFGWGGPSMTVAVFEVDEGFRGTRDITASIRAAIQKGAAITGKAQSEGQHHAVPSKERGSAINLPGAVGGSDAVAED